MLIGRLTPFARRLEMLERRVRLVQEAQRDPAREEFRIRKSRARLQPVPGCDVIGELIALILQRVARQRLAFAPPAFGRIGDAAVGRRLQQDLIRLFVPVAAAIGARRIMQQPAIAMQLRRQRRHDARNRIRAALDPEARVGRRAATSPSTRAI